MSRDPIKLPSSSAQLAIQIVVQYRYLEFRQWYW